MERPVLFFSPAIAPSGLSFYSGTRMAGLQNDLFFATLRGQHIHRVRLNADRASVEGAERWLEGRFGRIRDVVAGPDGAIYFCTNNRDGRGSPAATDDRILRIVPR
jgi:glucose/arabinose dehydrogenase